MYDDPTHLRRHAIKVRFDKDTIAVVARCGPTFPEKPTHSLACENPVLAIAWAGVFLATKNPLSRAWLALLFL